jgi:hypothetical protein
MAQRICDHWASQQLICFLSLEIPEFVPAGFGTEYLVQCKIESRFGIEHGSHSYRRPQAHPEVTE